MIVEFQQSLSTESVNHALFEKCPVGLMNKNHFPLYVSLSVTNVLFDLEQTGDARLPQNAGNHL